MLTKPDLFSIRLILSLENALHTINLLFCWVANNIYASLEWYNFASCNSTSYLKYHTQCCRWVVAKCNSWKAWVTQTLPNTVKCHYNTNASLTRSIIGSQTAPKCPHNHPQVAQHMGKRCEIIAVWSATAAMTPLCSHTNGIKQRYPTCWLCQYSGFMIDLRSNTLIIHLWCSENTIIRPIWLLDTRMLKTIPVAIKLT